MKWVMLQLCKIMSFPLIVYWMLNNDFQTTYLYCIFECFFEILIKAERIIWLVFPCVKYFGNVNINSSCWHKCSSDFWLTGITINSCTFWCLWNVSVPATVAQLMMPLVDRWRTSRASWRICHELICIIQSEHLHVVWCADRRLGSCVMTCCSHLQFK